jgi:hypothetical protein
MLRKVLRCILILIILALLTCPTLMSGYCKQDSWSNLLWQTDNLGTLEVLKVIPGELYVRYKAPDAVNPKNDEERFIGYKNIIQRVNLTNGELMWDEGFTNTVMEHNSLGNLVQRKDDILVTIRSVVSYSQRGNMGVSMSQIVGLNPINGQQKWTIDHNLPVSDYVVVAKFAHPYISNDSTLYYYYWDPDAKIEKLDVLRDEYDLKTGELLFEGVKMGGYAVVQGSYGSKIWGCNELSFHTMTSSIVCLNEETDEPYWGRNIQPISDRTTGPLILYDIDCFITDDFVIIGMDTDNDYYIFDEDDADYVRLCVFDRYIGELIEAYEGNIFYVWNDNLIYNNHIDKNYKIDITSVSLDTLEENWTLEKRFRDFGRHDKSFIRDGNKFTYYGDRMYIQETHSGADESIIHVYDLDDGEEIDSFTIGCEANELYIVDCKLLALNWNDGILYCYELEDCEVVEEENKYPDCEPVPEPEPTPEPTPEPEPEPEPVPEPVPEPEPEPIPEPDVTTLEFQIDRMSYLLDGNQRDIDVAPVIKNGRTLLPARYVTEPLGGDVTWDGGAKKVVCMLNDNTVELWIDMPNARVNGSVIPIDPDNPEVTPTIINDRTMVPMRFLAESMGCEVEWIAETKEIILTYTP